MTKINTSGKRFNEIAHLVKAIPRSKVFSGKRYNLHTSSFSSVTQNNQAASFRKAGIKARIVEYKRAGRTVYSIYSKSR